jgi:hypothetical protein
MKFHFVLFIPAHLLHCESNNDILYRLVDERGKSVVVVYIQLVANLH